MPEKANPEISPDGKKLAYLALIDSVLNIWVKEIREKQGKPITGEKERSIIYYTWAGDSQHIIYLQDSDGDENWHIYRVDIETGKVKDLTPFEGVQARFLKSNPLHPDQMLIELNKRDKSLHDVYKLNIRTGRIKPVIKNPGNIMTALPGMGWVADRNLNIIGAHIALNDGGTSLHLIEKNREFREIHRWTLEEPFSLAVGVTPRGEGFYLLDNKDTDTTSLVYLDIKTGERKLLFSDPEYDAGIFGYGLIRDPLTEEILAISVDKERKTWVSLSPDVEKDIEFLNKFHKGDWSLVSSTTDKRIWIVRFIVDTAPVEYYLYNRKKREMKFLFTAKENLKKYKLAEMKSVKIKSRDGFELQCYLTLPSGIPHKSLPMVLYVHGGPWHRDSWGFEPFSQFFANRGYACLQVNFRGSTGFGKKFLNAGDKEWGRNMHNDIVDGVNWAIKEGIADPERIAIFGGSYGGYASLVGATFTPDLFCCAVDECGPSNLITFIRAIPAYWKTFLSIFNKRIGDPDKEEQLLKSRSPLFYIDRIKIPLLIAQGAKDPRVKKEESEQIVKELREKGKNVEYILFEDEGHGLLKQENRLKFAREVDRFLSEHLGGRRGI